MFTQTQAPQSRGRTLSPTNVKLSALCVCVTLAVTNSRVSHRRAGPLTLVPAELGTTLDHSKQVSPSCSDLNECRSRTPWKHRKCTFPYQGPDCLLAAREFITCWRKCNILLADGFQRASVWLLRCVLSQSLSHYSAVRLRSVLWMLR